MPSRSVTKGRPSIRVSTRLTPKGGRRAPKQERSQATIDIILDGTVAVLVQDGYEKTNTNRIAKKSGVSVGSIYQYFSNKEEIVAMLVERHHSRVREMLLDSLANAEGSIEDLIKQTTELILEFNLENFKLCQTFHSELPQSLGQAMVQKHLKDCIEIVAKFLEAHRSELKVKNVQLSSEIMVHATMGALFGVDFDPRNHEQRAAFIEEMKALSVSYLLK